MAVAPRAQTYIIVEGTSEPQDFQLWDDDAELIGTGLTLGLRVYRDGALVTTSAPSVAWISAALGTVRVTGCESLTVGEYHVRYTLTDGASKVGFVPGGPTIDRADRWIVVAAYA